MIKKKIILAVILIVIGSIVIGGSIYLAQSNKNDSSKKEQETNIVANDHVYQDAIIENGQFTYQDGKMQFTATMINKGKDATTETTAMFVLYGKEKEVLTEQTVVLPALEVEESMMLSFEFEDVYESISDYEFK